MLLNHGSIHFTDDLKIIIRINDLETPYWEEDLEAVIPFRPDVIMPTKVSGAPYIQKLDDKMSPEQGARVEGRQRNSSTG